MNYDYQIAVIGGGSGGLTVAAGAASFGASVALIERKSELGGDCLHYGCMPSKALIHAAEEVYQTGQLTGLSDEQYDRLFTQAMEKVSKAVTNVQAHDSKDRFKEMGVDIYQNETEFIDDHTLQVGSRMITAKRIVIAAGSSPVVPPIEGVDEVDYLTNESIFSLRERPESLVVIGGGVIGLELAQAMARLGVNVTMIEAGERIAGKEDKEIASIAQKVISEQTSIITEAKVERVDTFEGRIKVHFSKEGSKGSVEADKLLIAVGRQANTECLSLDKAGIVTKEGAIDVDPYLRTSKKHIYAVGDCNGSMPFTHVAGMEGKVVVSNAVLGLSRKASYEKVPWVVYTAPEIYHLGLTEEEAHERYGDRLLTFKTKLSDNDRFMAEHHTEGLVKILTTSRGKIVGAHAIGPGAGEWMQEVGTIQGLNKKFQSLSNVIHPYPARNNAVSQTADLYWREKLFDSKINQAISWYVQTFR
ncbi:NAD(P)/FAD-dependent oxidoreductase [Halobacillus shinanisalinarum]|uniref:NAD(P)/FAD-dependent oxidoreductase n=1 Tax=Halobacillus shinanisalinarum TaxID=2932258 RepID=A0ABY4GYB1_9BACI|nr:NAD(P)/FAD-dependent oxidoreductase [Halobacillus shinanisalinarum]UOQ92675.1 NAD(P)/FAD-dependent oxidoreductase [Halobacillus shinanisalinarum]